MKTSQMSKEEELRSIPGPKIVRELLDKSISNDFDEARTEWEYMGYIPADSHDFVEHCELCGHANYKANFLISNPSTFRQLKVGSDCIRRFIILNGLESQEESNRFFDIKVKEKDIIFELKSLFKDVVTDPVPLAIHVSKFKKLFGILLDARGFKLNEAKNWGLFKELNNLDQIEHLKNVIQLEVFSEREISELQMMKIIEILYIPNKVVMQKEKRKVNKKNDQPVEGETWAKKGRVTHISLSKSKVYRNPDNKY